ERRLAGAGTLSARRELPAHYLENHRAHHSIFTTTGAIGVSETSFPDIEGQLPISPDIVPQRAGVTTVWFGSFDSLANQPNGPPVSGNAVERSCLACGFGNRRFACGNLQSSAVPFRASTGIE